MLDRAVPPGETPVEGPSAGSEEGRPVARLTTGGLAEAVAAAAAALGRATLADPFNGYYRMGRLLVRPLRLAEVTEQERASTGRVPGALVIAPADPDALLLELTKAADWRKFRGGRGEEPADVPVGVAKALIATAPDWLAIPVLTGIVEAPTLRWNGTVLDRPGYDPATGLLFDPGGTEFPPVPERPTREQAEAALAKLAEVLKGFPFADEASRSVAVSALVTPLVRKACRAVPLHAITAPKMASGKTLLATLGSYVATGRTPALMPQVESSAEERKRLLTVLMEGHAVVVIDNVERDLQSDSLCTVLTEETFTDRLLSLNKTARAPSRATFLATGNNLVLAGDLTARAISCALDPECERPEEREFDVNLHEEVPRRRAELAVAVLTIVRAYLAACEPEVMMEDPATGERIKLPNFARFEDWCRFVREPLVWLGMADPCAGRERVEGRDPVRAQLDALLEAWHENFPGKGATVAEAIKQATPPDRTQGGARPYTDRQRRLLEAMSEMAGKNGSIDSRALGHFIRKHESRREGGLRFERAGTSDNVVRWRVAEDEPPGSMKSLG